MQVLPPLALQWAHWSPPADTALAAALAAAQAVHTLHSLHHPVPDAAPVPLPSDETPLGPAEASMATNSRRVGDREMFAQANRDLHANSHMCVRHLMIEGGLSDGVNQNH